MKMKSNHKLQRRLKDLSMNLATWR